MHSSVVVFSHHMVMKLVCDWCSCAFYTVCLILCLTRKFICDNQEFNDDQYWLIFSTNTLITDWSFKTVQVLIDNRSLPVKTWWLKHCQCLRETNYQSIIQSISGPISDHWSSVSHNHRAVRKATSQHSISDSDLEGVRAGVRRLCSARKHSEIKWFELLNEKRNFKIRSCLQPKCHIFHFLSAMVRNQPGYI